MAALFAHSPTYWQVRTCKNIFCCPADTSNETRYTRYLNRHNVWYTLESDFNKILPEVDVVYMTHFEEEKIPAASIEKPFKRYFIDEESIKLMRSNAILMHPLPRLNEISPKLDTDPRAAYLPPDQEWCINTNGSFGFCAGLKCDIVIFWNEFFRFYFSLQPWSHHHAVLQIRGTFLLLSESHAGFFLWRDAASSSTNQR